jgi:hypothetical protein
MASFSPSCRLYEPEAWRPRVFLRQAQDRLTLRRTVQVRLGPIPRYRGTVARWHAHLPGLATAIHQISGLRFRVFDEKMITIGGQLK